MSICSTHYQYRALPPDTIRVLCLLPDEDTDAPIRCRLVNHPLPRTARRCYYDALSYVWGDLAKPQKIAVDAQYLLVTDNLHKAIYHLRDRYIERFVWIDAVCINQDDTREQEAQIRMMWRIYSLANRVIVWLGVAADQSDLAIEHICLTGTGKARRLLENDNKQPICSLLQRPWFRRIWVLQEVAAARQITMMCGSSEVDGYIFCLGIHSLKSSYGGHADLQALIPSVTYLIRGALFRPPNLEDSRPLGDLVDMYHTREASKRHDKVYALLGMSSNDTSRPELQPDYAVPWEQVMERLTKSLLGNRVRVRATRKREAVAIRGRGFLLGVIYAIDNEADEEATDNESQTVTVHLLDTSNLSPSKDWWNSSWTLRSSHKRVHEGDLVCQLEGAANPVVLRSRGDCLVVIKISPAPPCRVQAKADLYSWSLSWPQFLQVASTSTRTLHLVWDWENDPDASEGSEAYRTLLRQVDWLPEELYRTFRQNHNGAAVVTKMDLEDDFEKATRIWHTSLILEDAGRSGFVWTVALRMYETMFGPGICSLSNCTFPCGLTPFIWAILNRYRTVIEMLFIVDDTEIDPKDDLQLTSLSPSAQARTVAMIRSLPMTGNIEVNSTDHQGRSALSYAAESGMESTVLLLLKTDDINVGSKNDTGRTPLSYAVEVGNVRIVKLLVQSGNAEIDVADENGRTPLAWGAMSDHAQCLKLLLQTGKVDVNVKDNSGNTALSHAAGSDNDIALTWLLDAANVDANSRDCSFDTPLHHATRSGHKMAVKMLLQSAMVAVDAKNSLDQTPLYCAMWQRRHIMQLIQVARAGTGTRDSDRLLKRNFRVQDLDMVIELLLKTGKVDIRSRDAYGETPLSLAWVSGDAALMEMLLKYDRFPDRETGHDVNADDSLRGSGFTDGFVQGARGLRRPWSKQCRDWTRTVALQDESASRKRQHRALDSTEDIRRNPER